MAELPDAPWATPSEGLTDAPWASAPAPTAPSMGFDQFDPAGGYTGIPDAVRDRAVRGFAIYAGDVADMFKEGVHITTEAMMRTPGKISDQNKEIGAEIGKQLRMAGATEEEANRESARLMETLEHRGAIMNMIFGPAQAIFSPLMAPLRSFISRPIEEETGFPKEVTEGYLNVGLAVLGMRTGAPKLVRTRISEGGRIEATPIGGLPTEADFKVGAEVLAGEVGTTPKIKLERAGKDKYDIRDADGNTLATADIGIATIDGRKLAQIDDINTPALDKVTTQAEHDAAVKEARNALGPSKLREAMRQFLEMHPDVEGFTGNRVSGARNAGEMGPGNIQNITVNLRRLWNEEGIHPAEAVNDAQTDAFLRHVLTEIESDPALKLPPDAWSPEALAEKPYELKAGGAIGFKTAKGSAYELHEDGTTTRTKAARADVGHEGDSGLKPRTERTVYVDTPEQASELSAAGLQDLGSKGARVIIKDGKASLLTWNEKAGQWGRTASGTDIPISTEPGIGKAPLELWKKSDDIPGYESYRGMHAGNAITEITGENPLRAVGAEVTTDPPLVSPAVQPLPPPGKLSATFHDAGQKLFDLGRDAQMLVAPMATGTRDSMALAKDFADRLRRNRWEWARTDADIEKRFNPEQRKRMFEAMDEESVALQKGESREHQGLVTLTAEERAAVTDLDTRQQLAWMRARDLGMVEGEGIPMHATRFVMNITNASDRQHALSLDAIGRNLTVKTPFMRQRKHLTVEETEAAAKAKFGEQAVVARDIRAVSLSTAALEDAIAGRTLVNNIKEYGKRTGIDTVTEGGKPAGTDAKWFTIDHPALKTWRPKFERDAETGKTTAVMDAKGNVIFEQVPIYIHGDFEGPLRAILSHQDGRIYGGVMALKGKTMSLIMNSPAIHNMVILGKVIPAFPGKALTGRLYFEGNRAKNNIPLMQEAIDNGLVPIGKRFFNQDITGIMESPDLAPGRSWTAKVFGQLGYLPERLFREGPKAEASWLDQMMPKPLEGTTAAERTGLIKQDVDKAGDFWHNTLLWDRIADLQMGVYTNLRDNLLSKGVDAQTASREAAHFANRFAGSIPQEAMSNQARKTLNVFLFSRSFNTTNWGVFKDVLTGLPKDLAAQIERDVGAINPEALSTAKSLAKRKAIATIVVDTALLYAGNSMLQSIVNVMSGDHTIDKEMHGYAERMQEALQKRVEHPLSVLQPFDFLESLSSTAENEPGKKDRIKIGTTKDGTAVYARNPVGKFPEEIIGYLSGPLDMIRRKEGTIARPIMATISNDKGFGRKVYDPNADTIPGYAMNAWKIAEHFMLAQTPEGQIRAVADLVKGDGDKYVNLAQAFGPTLGVTFSKGAPGGPAVGEMYHARAQHDYAVQVQLSDIRKQIQRGDVEGAQQRMQELGIPPGLQKFYIRTSVTPSLRLSPRAIKDFYQYSTDEQKARMERLRQ